ncbi:Gluconate 5-dehydrogenase [Cytospora mali]|uniref:Gluconate 5-dehydrogenase n=1 Tax=Cytospora mali TaxID=578113 RepID=A0A194W8N3_CYTMA|nr:Gluconate 5-dehydrogenase [Valsa mali]
MAHLLPQNLFGVQGYTVIITGSGIGRMLSKGFSVNGAKTILVDVNEEGLEKTIAESAEAARSVGVEPNISMVVGDLSSRAGVDSIVSSIRTMTIEVDVIIHCAAYRHLNPVEYKHDGLSTVSDLKTATESASWESWDRSFQVNVLAPYFLTAGLIDLLGAATKQGFGRGSVVLFSSPASVHNHQFVPAYQTTKAAVDHLTRILAAEFSDFYIRVNAMSPGLIPSGMSDPNDPTSNLHLAKDSPARIPGGEEDMVGTAIWLSSRAGAFMDGKVVRCDGGRLLVLRGVVSNID